jgi:hypothetical protein
MKKLFDVINLIHLTHMTVNGEIYMRSVLYLHNTRMFQYGEHIEDMEKTDEAWLFQTTIYHRLNKKTKL